MSLAPISMVIPVLNEAENLRLLLPHLLTYCPPHSEVIVVDGGSTDDSKAVVASFPSVTWVPSPVPGRSRQLNLGVSLARHEVLYFIHADTLPPATFAADIFDGIQAGFPCGSYRSWFPEGPWIMRFNAWLTRFNLLFCRGGDQSIYVTRPLFEQTGGFREDYLIMEDYDFLAKVRKLAPFRVIPKKIRISCRKYDQNSYLKVNLANITVVTLYRFGASQQRLVDTYRRMLNYR